MNSSSTGVPSQRGDARASEGSAVIITDTAGRIVAWDHGAERLYGWTPEEAMGRTVSELLIPDDHQDAGEKIVTDLGDRASAGWQGRFPVRRKDGTVFEAYVQDSPIVVDGRVVAILGQSTPVDRLRSLDAEMAAMTTGGVGAVLEARLDWYDSFLSGARSAISIRELEDLLQDALSTVANSLGADAASLLVTDDDGVLIARSAYGWDAEITRILRIPPGAGVSGKVLATREPLIVDELDEVEVASPQLRRSGFHSFVGVPLIERNRVVGVLHATSHEPARFSEADVETLTTLAAPLASAIHRVRQFVQLANLSNPTRLPPVEGAEILTTYQAADGGTGGGDWYDAITRQDGTVAVVIGDAAGHGIDALISASSVRHALIAYLYEGHSPSEALAQLQGLMAAASFGSRADFLTVQACIFDRCHRTLQTASAGHPPLLHVRDGVATYGPAAGPPISTSLPSHTYVDHTLQLEPGDVVVLYTDGIIEIRGQAIDDGLEALRSVAAEHHRRPLSALCEELLGINGAVARTDDSSIVLLRAL